MVLRFIVGDDRPCPAERFGILGLPNIPNPESRIWSEQQGEYLSEVCVSEQDTRTPDVYDRSRHPASVPCEDCRHAEQ